MWRIRLDTTANRLALEVRDPDLLLASFYTMDLGTRHLKQLPLPQGTAWWQGLEEAQDSYIYLHGYGDRRMGQHKGVLAVEAGTAAVAWEETELAFYGMAADGMLAYIAATPEAAFRLLQPATGQVVQDGITQQQAAAMVAQHSHLRYRQAVYPVLYREGEEYFAQVQQFLDSQQLTGATQAIEYAETDAYLAVSYYVQAADSTLQNYMAVFDIEGSLCLKERLAGGLSGIGSDTFFIFMGDLYFVKDKAILKVYRLLA
ncbi:hypothetical protein GCM10023188_31190 [Pontibacter saemangeumensis]|uniref:DUF4905 domain-containing protein n=1 Tax=Pontibacter saemangeumensis TaxID=1084525 RepID=A0ABP8LW89_9BACT